MCTVFLKCKVLFSANYSLDAIGCLSEKYSSSKKSCLQSAILVLCAFLVQKAFLLQSVFLE